MRGIRWLFLSIVIVGCSPNSLEDFYLAGETISKDLCKQLKDVHSLDDLKHRSPELKKKMRKLTKLMIDADKYHQKHLAEEITYKETLASDMLCYELFRVCEEVEGGKETLEALQLEMLDELDKFMHRKDARKSSS